MGNGVRDAVAVALGDATTVDVAVGSAEYGVTEYGVTTSGVGVAEGMTITSAVGVATGLMTVQVGSLDGNTIGVGVRVNIVTARGLPRLA